MLGSADPYTLAPRPRGILGYLTACGVGAGGDAPRRLAGSDYFRRAVAVEAGVRGALFGRNLDHSPGEPGPGGYDTGWRTAKNRMAGFTLIALSLFLRAVLQPATWPPFPLPR